MRRHAGPLELVWVEVPEAALDVYVAALSESCDTVGFFLDDEARRRWRVEGVRAMAAGDGDLAGALALARIATGIDAPLERAPIAAEGWLARTQAAFPEQLVGRRFAVHGTHQAGRAPAGRILLRLDAGLAFGSGEHGSTRGCLRALERIAWRKPRRVLDLGTGSGILAIAAAKLLHRPVLATDIEPWAVRVAGENARLNGVAHLVHPLLASGWRGRAVRAAGPYDLVLANILARPLCLMARDLAYSLAPGGVAILSGLLVSQARLVLAAHRRQGLRLAGSVREGDWTTLIVQKRPPVRLDC